MGKKSGHYILNYLYIERFGVPIVIKYKKEILDGRNNQKKYQEKYGREPDTCNFWFEWWFGKKETIAGNFSIIPW